MKTNKTEHSRWQQFLSGLAMIAVASLTALTLSGCSGSSSDAAPPAATVAAPGAPTAFTATNGENLVTLQWSPPASSATAGLPTSYVIYVSTTPTSTAATVFAPENLLATMPVVPDQTVYTFTNSALAGTTEYFYVVTAKNAGGETPSTLASATPTGSPNPVVTGNNFSGAMVFADDIGITNSALDPLKSWTITDMTAIDYNTGLRPLSTEAITVLPFLSVPSKVDPLYFEQKSVNTWQGEWVRGGGTMQNVTAKWGDNLTGTASLSSSSKIRLEMVLTTTVPTTMTTYTMKSLYGSKTNEMFGTNGVVIPSTTAFVFATNAHLVIQKYNGTALDAPIVDQALFNTAFPDGLNKLSAEIPVSGNFTYGFVWSPSALTPPAGAGTYRITFKLDPTSLFGVGGPPNHTLMTAATNGMLVSPTEAYIDITVK